MIETILFVGVDIGKDGGICVIDDKSHIFFQSGIPKVKGTNEVDYFTLSTIFRGIFTDITPCEKIVVVIEDVHSLYGMSAKSNFNFGHIKGFKEGVLTTLNSDYTLVAPKTWQRVVWEEQDVVIKKGKKDTKATSLNTAQRIWPNHDFRKSNKARKPHDGIIDAALMAEYARIVNKDNDGKET